jgi:hypothetical protein
MILDINTLLSSAQAITVTAPSTFVIDLAGQGVGVADPNIFGQGGGATIFGEDIGIGDGMSPPNLLCVVTTAFTAAGAGTLQVQLQAAPDTGANTGTPGTWSTLVQTDAIALASLTKGQKIAEFTVPPNYPGLTTKPRFLRVNYVVATGPMTAGAVTASIITGRDDQPAYPAGF